MIEYEIQGQYGNGWETVHTVDTLTEAKESRRVYDIEESGYPHRIIKVRGSEND